jgi:hypothetical protein
VKVIPCQLSKILILFIKSNLKKLKNILKSLPIRIILTHGKIGLVREQAFTNFDHKRYDPIITPHAHLIFSNCGQTTHVKVPFHVAIPDEYSQGFFIKDSEVNFYGLCPVCNTNDKKPSAQYYAIKTTISFTEKTGSKTKA